MNIHRTPFEIRTAIFEACGDKWKKTDYFGHTEKAIKALVNKIIWAECEPEEGWYKAAQKRLAILDTMPEPDERAGLFFDSPKVLADDIRKCVDEERYIDLAAIDEFIEEHKDIRT